MPSPRAFAGAGVVQGRIYVLGGYDGQSELAACTVYDPQTNRWSHCPDLRAPRGGVAVATVEDRLYAIGGGWENYLVENEYLGLGAEDPNRDVWQTFASPFLQEWRNLGLVSWQASLYAVGGWNGDLLGDTFAYRVVYRVYLPMSQMQ